MKNRQVHIFHAAAALAALALAGCGAAVKKDDGAAVEARAAERWNLLIAHQAEKAYDYLTPGFRQTITREKYASDKNDVALRWKSAKVSGPIGWLRPSWQARSMSRIVATPSPSAKHASLSIGISTRLTMKPGASLARTTCLPSFAA